MPQQRTRFAPTSLSTMWSRVIEHLQPPSHPSTTSQSAIDSSFQTDLYYSESVSGPSGGVALDLLNPRSGTESRHKRGGIGGKLRRAKSSQANSNSRYGDDDDQQGNPWEPVSHTVVDANFDHFIPPTAKSDSGSTTRTPGASQAPTPGGKESEGQLVSKAGDDDDRESMAGNGEGRGDGSSIRRDRRASWLERSWVYEALVERVWPNTKHFLDSRFPEAAKERSFQKEAWFTQKQGALACAAFFLISWILTVALQPKPLSHFVLYMYLGVGGILTLPIPFLVIFDQPRRRPWLWQPYLLGATWILADILLGEMWACGFFTDHSTCGSRNFLNTLGFAFGQPTLAILTLKQNRVFAAFGAIQWLVICGILVMGQGGAPALFYRNMVNFALFHIFLIGSSFLKERSDRQMFALRQQLKIQYRATQSAQVMERRASDSKKRFVSYIFHEVRVPLNTALLAVQNLEGEHVFSGLASDQAEMVHGLMGSLTMMEKVLNDVLSFNRMESGKFIQARKPFEFHKSIQLVALSHRMQAQMAGIDLVVDLDKDIDRIGGVFVGDEMRLRQVASNLVSNSIKFTDQGSVRIVTKLLYPRMEPSPGDERDDPMTLVEGGDPEKGSIVAEARRQSTHSGKERERDEQERRRHKAVIRVEVHDTGVGLKKQDVIDNRLFSPYVQTEIGRRQGGKGSGLGLALVRQIVKLSNGRLGVESEFGKGSMFWFELPYSLPPPPKTRSRETSSGAGAGSPFLAAPPALDKVPMPLEVIGEQGEKVGDKAEHRPDFRLHESQLPLLPHPPLLTPTGEPLMEEASINAPFVGVTPSSDATFSDPFGGRLSSEGSGSMMGTGPRIEVPKDSPNRAGSGVPPPLPSPEVPLNTLVVDDDKLTRMLMSRMLTRLGHTVTTAENGKLALDLIRASYLHEPNTPSFDIVFLDNQMPLMSGVEVARATREMGNPLYIVGCTGNALREDQEEYLGAGADGIIPKPIHQKAVLDMIKEARKRVRGETRPKDVEMDSPGLGMGQEGQGRGFNLD